MFTPELINQELGEYILVANHNLENTEAISMSIQYNRARIAFGSGHLPDEFTKCRLIYDIRGQTVSENTIRNIIEALSPICVLEFKK